MVQDLTNKVIWVTGATSGIGEAAAVHQSTGARIVASGRREERLQALAARLPSPHLTIPLDVADETAVFSSAKQITEAFGRIDVLVHSAGLNITERSWDEITPSGWNEVIQVDLNGAFYCNQAVLPVMRDQKDGLIINVSSWAGRFVSRVSGGAYSAAKHGLNAMTESINQENCQFGIRATALCPGEVATEILDRRPVPVSPEDRARMVQSEDVADLIEHIVRTPPHVCLNEITSAQPGIGATYEEHEMKVGVGIFATDYTIDLGDLAVMAEESGFESLLVPEHTHIPLSRKSPGQAAHRCLTSTTTRLILLYHSLLLLRGRSEFSLARESVYSLRETPLPPPNLSQASNASLAAVFCLESAQAGIRMNLNITGLTSNPDSRNWKSNLRRVDCCGVMLQPSLRAGTCSSLNPFAPPSPSSVCLS